jgi:hypothetical protein
MKRWRWLVMAAAALVAAGAVGLSVWPGAAALLNVTAAKLTTQTFTDVVGTATLLPYADRDGQTHNQWSSSSTETRCNSPSVQCYTLLNDNNANTYIFNSNPSSGQRAQFELDDAPGDVPTSGSPVVSVRVSFDAKKSGNTAMTVRATVALKLGTTTVASASDSDISATGETVTGSEVAVSLSRTDVNNLYIEVTGTTSGGGPGGSVDLQVSSISVQITYLK